VPAAGANDLSGANFRCLLSGAPIGGDYIKAEPTLVAGARSSWPSWLTVCAGAVFSLQLPSRREAARQADPSGKPDTELFRQALGFRVGNYGMSQWSDLFTPRHSVALGHTQ
jgi:putative DNA methylase